MLLLVGLLVSSAGAATVLFSPSTLIPVHSYNMAVLANELANRGHKVTWLEYGPRQTETVLSKAVTRKYLPAQFGDRRLEDLYIAKQHDIYKMIWYEDFDWPNEQTTGWMAGIRLCDQMLNENKDKFDKLIKEEFDTVVVDDLYNPCGLLLAGLKGSVFVYWSMTGLRPESAWANQSPHPPSYLPTPGTKLTEDLSLLQRSYNLAAYLKELYIHQHIIHRRMDSIFQKHYPGVASAFDLERNASLNFVNTPPIYDFARPYMPRVNFVGGLHCHNATALTGDLAKFVDSAEEESGFVVISGGHTARWEYAPNAVKEAFERAIQAHPKTKFIWQSSETQLNLVPNAFLKEWLPLQDLLGHKKCKAHISHGGLNSLIESVWHGVPVIGFPLTVRGFDNLLRLTHRGVGVMLTKSNLTAESLSNALSEIREEKYKTEMLVFQDMVRDVPYTELNHAAFWIEFIERHHEIPHARSGADKLNALQYFLVDVIAFLLSVAAICLALIAFLVKSTFRILRSIFRKLIGRSQPAPVTKVTKAKKRN